MNRMGQKRVSAKVSKLMHEGKPQKQAVAMSMSMERAGRLGEKGGYKRKKKGVAKSPDRVGWLHK